MLPKVLRAFRRWERASGLARGLSKMFSGRADLSLAAYFEPGADPRRENPKASRRRSWCVERVAEATAALASRLLGPDACAACCSGERDRRTSRCYTA